MAVIDSEPRPAYGTKTPQTPRRGPTRSVLVATLIVSSLAAISVLSAGWLYTGYVQHQTHSIPAAGVSNATVSLNFGAGSLRLDGNAAPRTAVQASIVHNTPGFTWSESHFRGALTLSVAQKSGSIWNPFNTRNDWTVRLGRQVPVELQVNSGAGEANLDLRRVNLRSLDVNTGAGSVHVDLRRSWSSAVKVFVRGGVGETTIEVPTSVGVLVHVHSGVGSTNVTGLVQRNGDYVNQQYGHSPVTLRIAVDQGVGTINLKAG